MKIKEEIITNKTIAIQKPFLKWVGGKTQILNTLLPKIPATINNYHEIFLGGGSVLLAILSLQQQNKITIKGNIYAYDINTDLINLYKDVQKNKDKLFKLVTDYLSTYDSLTGNEINRKPKTITEAKTSKESYYYWIRDKFNKTNTPSEDKSAMFLFLNKTCFRGIYRVGPNGFNVPYGHYKKTPEIINKEKIDKISKLIQNVHFEVADFGTSLKKTLPGDFVYLDPPYAPENSTSFVGYTKDGFNLETHKKLFTMIKSLDKKIKILMSNAKVELVLSYFKTHPYNIQNVKAKRAIHSKKPNTTTTEIMIWNYFD